MPGIQESDRHQHIGIPEKLIKEPDSGKEKEQIMEFIAECKLMGDGYAGGFSCGMRRPFPFTERRQRSSDPERQRGLNAVQKVIIIPKDSSW